MILSKKESSYIYIYIQSLEMKRGMNMNNLRTFFMLKKIHENY